MAADGHWKMVILVVRRLNMKTILLAILMATATAQASRLGDIRKMMERGYAMDPVGAEHETVVWNLIAASIVENAGHKRLDGKIDYKQQFIMVQDPWTEEKVKVKILLNDLKPILILRALAKHREEVKETRDPLLRTILHSPITVQPGGRY